MKKNTLTIVLSIVGALVVVAGAVAAIIHFWEDIKAKLPCKCRDEMDDFCDELEEDLEEDFEEEEPVEFVDYEEEA